MNKLKSRKKTLDDGSLSLDDNDYGSSGVDNARKNDSEIPNYELNTLRATSQRTRLQISSLEGQLTRLEKANARLNNDLIEIESKLLNTSKEVQQIQAETEETRTKIRISKEKRESEFREFEKNRINFDESKNKFMKDIALLTNQNTSIQHELLKAASRCSNLLSTLNIKDTEISSLKSEIERYTDQQLSNDAEQQQQQQNSNVSLHLLILENEISRLRERSNKIQQKILHSDNTLQELEHRLQTEIRDTKQKQNEVEQKLFEEKNENEQFNKKLEQLRLSCVTIHETAEIKWKRLIEEQRANHIENISTIKQKSLLSSSNNNNNNNNQSGEKLLQALAIVESLKSENRALEFNLESQTNSSHHSGNKNNNLSILNDTSGMNIEFKTRKSKRITFTAMLSNKASPAIFEFFGYVDSFFQEIDDFTGSRPLVRLLLIFWFVSSSFYCVYLFLRRLT